MKAPPTTSLKKQIPSSLKKQMLLLAAVGFSYSPTVVKSEEVASTSSNNAPVAGLVTKTNRLSPLEKDVVSSIAKCKTDVNSASAKTTATSFLRKFLSSDPTKNQAKYIYKKDPAALLAVAIDLSTLYAKDSKVGKLVSYTKECKDSKGFKELLAFNNSWKGKADTAKVTSLKSLEDLSKDPKLSKVLEYIADPKEKFRYHLLLGLAKTLEGNSPNKSALSAYLQPKTLSSRVAVSTVNKTIKPAPKPVLSSDVKPFVKSIPTPPQTVRPEWH